MNSKFLSDLSLFDQEVSWIALPFYLLIKGSKWPPPDWPYPHTINCFKVWTLFKLINPKEDSHIKIVSGAIRGAGKSVLKLLQNGVNFRENNKKFINSKTNQKVQFNSWNNGKVPKKWGPGWFLISSIHEMTVFSSFFFNKRSFVPKWKEKLELCSF